MIAHSLEELAVALRCKLDGIPVEADSLTVIRHVVVNLARNSADLAFWRVTTEGLSLEQAEALSASISTDNTASIADQIRRFGGGEDDASRLASDWLAAYRARLGILLAAPRQGGHA